MATKIESRPDGTRRVSLTFDEKIPSEKSRTRAEFHKDTDINRIIAKYRKTGILGDPLSYKEGMYGDFSSGEDFSQVMRKITAVQGVFNELPAPVRARFANDPRQLVDFLVDPANDDEAIKLGLKHKRPTPPPTPIQDGPAGTPTKPNPNPAPAAPAAPKAPETPANPA